MMHNYGQTKFFKAAERVAIDKRYVLAVCLPKT
jgi:hypothetical protein